VWRPPMDLSRSGCCGGGFGWCHGGDGLLIQTHHICSLSSPIHGSDSSTWPSWGVASPSPRLPVAPPGVRAPVTMAGCVGVRLMVALFVELGGAWIGLTSLFIFFLHSFFPLLHDSMDICSFLHNLCCHVCSYVLFHCCLADLALVWLIVW
jgi:hypothetical protein